VTVNNGIKAGMANLFSRTRVNSSRAGNQPRKEVSTTFPSTYDPIRIIRDLTEGASIGSPWKVVKYLAEKPKYSSCLAVSQMYIIAPSRR